MSTTPLSKIETPFTSGALRSGPSLDFWKAYVEARPSPTEDFFELIAKYHKSKGDARTAIAHDVGTGPGNIAGRLTAYFDHVVGSDLNGDALAVAPALAAPEIRDRLTFITSRAEDLVVNTPLASGGHGNTDLITVSECMPLLDAPKALKAWNNLLRPGGTVGIYFYGPAVFTDGDVDKCNAAYDKLATRICTFNQPMKGTPGFPFHQRAAQTLLSYMDDIAMPSEDWENVQRHKWNCDYPLLFNSKAGFDFDFEHVDVRAATETTTELIDREFWSAEWSIENVQAYLDSVYPNYRDKAGDRYSDVEQLLGELLVAMGEGKRKVTFPVVLILATKKRAEQVVPGQARVVRLSAERPGLGRLGGIPDGSIEKANELLQKNHDELHIFFRDVNGHNHMAHFLLTTFALGGTPAQLQRAYDHHITIQRPMPNLDPDVVNGLADADKMMEVLGQLPQYTNVLAFFEQELDKGDWKDVLHKYCFSRTKLADVILSRMYEGAYHPFIHLGLGVEFEQPSIIAEALAQAVTHPLSGIPECLLRTDDMAAQAGAAASHRSLADIFAEARAGEVIRNGPRWEDLGFKMRDGVLGRSKDEMTNLAAQYRVQASELDKRAAESVNWAACVSGAAQRAGKTPKIDFFHMHAVTSSIFLTVLLQQPWISLENKVRMVEWKGRADLLCYAASGCAELDLDEIYNYKAGESAAWDWSELYRAINAMHDDGHVAKFVRALKSAQDVCEPYEQQDLEHLPLKGDAWIKLARMCYDSTIGVPDEAKWVFGSGFPQAWGRTPGRADKRYGNGWRNSLN